jgi:hypothetical protein
MNQVTQASAGQSSGRWVGRVIVGVLAGEGLWGLIVSLTRDLIVPFLSRQMGAGAQAQQNINGVGIFAAVLALCLAGVVAVILNAWVNRPVRVSGAAVKTVQRASGSSLSITPTAQKTSGGAVPATAVPAAPASPSAVKPTESRAPASSAATPALAPAATASAPSAGKTAAAAPPPKPAKPKEIQYNIVGERISPMDEDE